MSDVQPHMRSRNQSNEATESQVIRRVLLLLGGLPTGKAQSFDVGGSPVPMMGDGYFSFSYCWLLV